MVMLFSGAWSETRARRRLDLQPGELLFHPPDFVHASGAVATSSEVVILRVDSSIFRTFWPLYGNVARDLHLPFESLRGVPHHIREELLCADAAAPVILESLAMQLLALGSRTPEAGAAVRPPWFASVLAHIHRSSASPLTVGTIAAEVGISESRLAHVFRAATGRSVAAYIRECRVRAAAKALRETATPIGEIALACGFYDQAHLTRAFKMFHDVTPLRYRRAQRRACRPSTSADPYDFSTSRQSSRRKQS